MVLDAFLQFTGVTPAAGIGNADGTDSPTTGAQTSTNIIDLHMLGIPVLASGVGARDIGVGDDPALKISAICTLAFAGGTSLILTLQGSPDNGSGAPLGFVSWWTSPTYALATLVQGAQLFAMDMPRPPDGVVIPRFLQFAYTSAGTFTGGAAGTASRLGINIVLDRFDQPYLGTQNANLGGYPAGITIPN
jgi:hypothetical protein